MGSGRNRSSGWQYAKLSGHENESCIEKLFDNKDFCVEFSKRIGINNIVSASVGGLFETDVESVLGGKTKSKTDLKLILKDNKFVNISIKKSRGGQVYLIGVERFIDGYEKQYSKKIPDNIKDLLSLYFYGNPKTEGLLNDPQVVMGESKSLIEYQYKHGRLVWTSLKNMEPHRHDELLQWFKDNIDDIADFCFSKGLAKDSSNWADYVWYVNQLDDEDLDIIFSIKDIKDAVSKNVDKIEPSKQNGGSTTLLPFGFVQWHQKKMQFHHKLDSLCEILKSKL